MSQIKCTNEETNKTMGGLFSLNFFFTHFCGIKFKSLISQSLLKIIIIIKIVSSE